jgi:hypothetical protein
MGDIVNIKPIRLEENQDFVRDCCRFQEGLLTEARMKMKYGFADGVWEKLGDNTALLEAVEDETLRRTRDGSTKREKSQQLIIKAPNILDSIATDPANSPRHRVDALKTLDSFAGGGQESAPAADRFVISINLTGDSGTPHILNFSKSLEPNAGDIDPYNDDLNTNIATPWGLVASISTKKDDGGNGNAL